MLYPQKTMDFVRNECLGGLKANFSNIRKRLRNLPDNKVEYMFNEIKDALHFYGFNRREIEKMITYSEMDFDHFNDERLHALEGVSNIILYQLKYKLLV